MQVYVASASVLAPRWLHELRAFLDAAYGGRFETADWEHAPGGMHVWMEAGCAIVSHAALVDRRLTCDGHELQVGYLEAVATAFPHRGQGFATNVMRHVGDLVQHQCPLGALSTAAIAFYRTLGWEEWRGKTFVDGPHGRQRTLDDDGDVTILATTRSPPLDLDAAIIADWRADDVW